MPKTFTVLSLAFLAILSATNVARAAAQEADLSKANVAAGKALFEDHCSGCHGMDGSGGRGPNLRHPRLQHAPDDAALLHVIEKGIPPGMPEGWYLTPEDITNVAGFIRSLGKVPPEKLPGDPAHGKAVYDSKGCTGCHILAGQGNGFGPDLSDVGLRRRGAQLHQILKDPAGSLPVNFMYVEATTASGETIRGVRMNEDSFYIQLKDVSGRIYSLRKTELKDLKKLRDQSPMPSFASLSSAEAEDLVAYLASQKGDQ